jgi:hypothetical protein
MWKGASEEAVDLETLEIPTILRKGGEAAPPGEGQPGEKRLTSLGVLPAKKHVVHPDLQYEESELDTPTFLRKTD